MSVYITAIGHEVAGEFNKVEISNLKQYHALFGRLTPKRSSAYYPDRSDEKIMRNDAISATMVVSNMLNDLNIGSDIAEDIALFVCGGVFMETSNKYISRILKAFGNGTNVQNEQQQLELMYRNTSPLLALETLTNSTTSFIAQYNSIKGHNGTYGNTCQSACYAIQDAIQNKSQRALVVGSNCSGTYSYLTFKNFYDSSNKWKESACAAAILLESEEADFKGTPLGKIKSIKTLAKAPSLTKKIRHSWSSFFDQDTPEFLIYSGGFTEEEFEKNRAEAAAICKNNFSWNHTFGNLGSATMMMNIKKAIEVLSEYDIEAVHILNRDPYERICHIIIEKITKK